MPTTCAAGGHLLHRGGRLCSRALAAAGGGGAWPPPCAAPRPPALPPRDCASDAAGGRAGAVPLARPAGPQRLLPAPAVAAAAAAAPPAAGALAPLAVPPAAPVSVAVCRLLQARLAANDGKGGASRTRVRAFRVLETSGAAATASSCWAWRGRAS